jgi:TPR repeat protein
MNLSSWGGGGFAWTEDLKAADYAALRLGAQIYHYHYRVQLLEKPTEGDQQEKVLGERSIEGKIPWQLLAEDAPALAPAVKADPALRAVVAKSIRVQYILRDDRDKTFVQTSIQVDHPPTGLAFEAAFRFGDQTLPLGPVAWTKGNTAWWGFDADLPENIKSADLVFTPSADAAAQLATEYPYRVADLTSIWGGEEIIISGVPIQTQRVGMQSIEAPSKRVAFEYALAQTDASDPVMQKMKRAGETKGARSELEQKLRDGQGDAKTNYELGCILTADGDLRGAMARFVEALRLQPAADSSWRIRRQQRRLCGMWLKLSESDDAASMEALALAYEHGWGAGVVIDEAKRWHLNASNSGNVDAMCRLAAIYDQKIGATIHNAEADEWYHAQALDWYRKSAALGNEEARQWLTKHDH